MKKMIALVSVVVLQALIIIPTAFAESNSENAFGSTYEVLVDRFYDGNTANNDGIDVKNPEAFAGGDFKGIIEKLDYIQKMGFQTISLTNIFATKKYDGSEITEHGMIEPHFGNEKEFDQLIAKAHKKSLKIMIDIPATTTENVNVYVQFLKKHAVNIVRFSEENVELETAIKSQLKNIEVMKNSSTETIWQNAFKTVDLPMDEWAAIAQNPQVFHTLDTLNSERFTAQAAKENMFPPTRVKVALGAMMALPGTPIMTYGTEIAMNGVTAAESHQYMNFKTEEEIVDYLSKLQTMRNESPALQSGNIEILHVEDGYVVLKRWSEDETWIVVINNTSRTMKYNVTAEQVGEGKTLRGMYESDIVRSDENGVYPLVIDREIVEYFYVEDRDGINKGYMVALGLVYVLFMAFIYFVWKKGRNKK